MYSNEKNNRLQRHSSSIHVAYWVFITQNVLKRLIPFIWVSSGVNFNSTYLHIYIQTHAIGSIDVVIFFFSLFLPTSKVLNWWKISVLHSTVKYWMMKSPKGYYGLFNWLILFTMTNIFIQLQQRANTHKIYNILSIV